MMRVAAHKLGSVSSFPQSDTVLTILTPPAEVREAAAARPNRRADSPINTLFTWLLMHSQFLAGHISKMGVFHLNLSQRWKNKSCAIHRPLPHVCNLRRGNGNPTRGENEVCVGSARLSLRAENWRNHSDGISREHRVLVSFSRNKGSSFLQPGPTLCINVSHGEKYEFPTTGLLRLQEMDLLEG